MKYFSAIIAACLIAAGCDEIADLLTFRISHSATVTIENTVPLDLPIELETIDIPTNSSQTFENNKTRADLVKDIKLEKINLTISSPPGGNFDFLKSVALYISIDGEPEAVLAEIDDVPLGATKVDLTPTDENLDKYIKASTYKLRTRVVTRKTIAQDVDVKVNMTFVVRAKAL